MRQIVVGVDGSASSQTALEWAVREAALREARLIVVHAWQVPASAYGNYPSLFADPEVYRSAARATVSQALTEIDPESVPLGIEVRLQQGSAASALLDAAEDAELIVLGPTRRRGLGRMLLGSTSRDVTREADVAVVIVPEHDHELAVAA